MDGRKATTSSTRWPGVTTNDRPRRNSIVRVPSVGVVDRSRGRMREAIYFLSQVKLSVSMGCVLADLLKSLFGS